MMELLNLLLSPLPADRPGSGALRSHPFFESVSWPKLLDSEEPSPLEDVSLEQFQLRLEDVDWDEADASPWKAGKGVDVSWTEGYTEKPGGED